MDAAQAETRWARTAYTIALAVLQLYAIPFAWFF
jgi:hypothetical protein